MFDMFKLVSSILLSFHHHMKSTSSSQHAIVVSLLSDRYSVCQIQSKSSIGESTVGRIKKEVDSDKKNTKDGHPSKLSHCDKQSIIRQITTGKLDNAVQATQIFSPLLSHHKQSEMHSKAMIFALLLSRNIPYSKRHIKRIILNLHGIMKTGQLRIEKGSYGQMKQR
jgi:transposase